MRFLMLSGLLLASCGYEPSSPLARAAFEKDSASFDRLLPGSAHAQIDEALVAAARAGNAEAIPKLAAADANLDRPSGVNEWTPLQHAVHKNQLSAVKALLASGASPQSGLIMAAGYGQADIVKALLEAGANPALAGPKEMRWTPRCPAQETLTAGRWATVRPPPSPPCGNATPRSSRRRGRKLRALKSNASWPRTQGSRYLRPNFSPKKSPSFQRGRAVCIATAYPTRKLTRVLRVGLEVEALIHFVERRVVDVLAPLGVDLRSVAVVAGLEAALDEQRRDATPHEAEVVAANEQHLLQDGVGADAEAKAVRGQPHRSPYGTTSSSGWNKNGMSIEMSATILSKGTVGCSAK